MNGRLLSALSISKIASWGTTKLDDSCVVETTGSSRMRKPKRTAEQLSALIKERALRHGPWPAKMTMLLYRMNDSWEVMVSPGKTVQEEEFRVTVLWIATQMQNEFDLR